MPRQVTHLFHPATLLLTVGLLPFLGFPAVALGQEAPKAVFEKNVLVRRTKTLRSLAQARKRQIGAAVELEPLQEEPLYVQTLAREFNLLTPENLMKWEFIHPERDRYDFTQAETLVSFAETHNMAVRGHTLVWHSQLPAWLTQGPWTRNQLIEILKGHISTVVGEYRDRVSAWDVVNEGVENDGSLRNTLWLRGIGPNYIEMAFRWAHAADPGALLFYNDYGGEGLGPKSDTIYALVRDLVQRGIPIHGVGLQMHISVDNYPDPAAVATNLRRLDELGLVVHITEMDVRIPEPATPEKLAKQAQIYRDMLEVCLDAKNCDAFVMWGVTDRHSWIPQVFDGEGSALLFDQDYQPKPAYNQLSETLAKP